jgi:hypothetical protein
LVTDHHSRISSLAIATHLRAESIRKLPCTLTVKLPQKAPCNFAYVFKINGTGT